MTTKKQLKIKSMEILAGSINVVTFPVTLGGHTTAEMETMKDNFDAMKDKFFKRLSIPVIKFAKREAAKVARLEKVAAKKQAAEAKALARETAAAEKLVTREAKKAEKELAKAAKQEEALVAA